MASENTLERFVATGKQSGDSALDTRNAHPVLDFDASTDENAVFHGVLSHAYAGGGLTVYVHYAMSSATIGDVVWNAAIVLSMPVLLSVLSFMVDAP